MIVKLIIGIVILYVFTKLWRSWKTTPADKRKPIIIKIVIAVVVAATFLAVATGRMHPLGALVAAIIPLARFGMGTAMKVLPFWMQRTGGVASFKTEYLNVRFHIQKARVEGSIIKGPHEGKNLRELSEDEIEELIAFYQGKDSKSYYLIKVFSKQGNVAGEDQINDQASPPSFGDPAIDEALEILGLEEEPTKEDITKAHRKLINKLHPDRGGSAFLASRVNQARDVLMKKFK